MTSLQQAIIHAFLVLVAVTAIVVLQVTGNLTTAAAGLVLAVTGFGSVGVAGLTSSPVPAAQVPAGPVAGPPAVP
jgi:hypothetical protein